MFRVCFILRKGKIATLNPSFRYLKPKLCNLIFRTCQGTADTMVCRNRFILRSLGLTPPRILSTELACTGLNFKLYIWFCVNHQKGETE